MRHCTEFCLKRNQNYNKSKSKVPKKAYFMKLTWIAKSLTACISDAPWNRTSCCTLLERSHFLLKYIWLARAWQYFYITKNSLKIPFLLHAEHLFSVGSIQPPQPRSRQSSYRFLMYHPSWVGSYKRPWSVPAFRSFCNFVPGRGMFCLLGAATCRHSYDMSFWPLRWAWMLSPGSC